MGKKLTKREKQKIKKTVSKNWKIIVAILLIIVMFLTIAYFTGWLDKFIEIIRNYQETMQDDDSDDDSTTGGDDSSRDEDDDSQVLSTAGGYVTTVTTLKDLEINFLDVGQGDCIIIEFPDGKNMIIDSGDKSNANKSTITEFTTENNITSFDYLLLTHQDSDHAGNMNWVIDNYEIKYIFRPNNYSQHANSADLPSDFNTKTEGGYVSTTATYANFMVSAYNENCTVEIFDKYSDFSNEIIYNGTTYTYSLDFLTPTVESESSIVYGDPNNYSPIVLLTYVDKKILFTGDAELENLGEYVTTYGNTHNVDVLKVGHHGSNNATTSAFISAIDPEYAIIQCGQDNAYNHPHQETLDILQSYDSEIQLYRNDTNGEIKLAISGLGVMTFTLENTDTTSNWTCGADMVWQSLSNYRFDCYLEKRKLFVA